MNGCKASHVNSFPTDWVRPWTYSIKIIITLSIQRDCSLPIPPALIGQTAAGNQDRKHRGITQEASGAASQSRWVSRCQRLQACNSAFFKMFAGGFGTTRPCERALPHRVQQAATLRLLKSLFGQTGQEDYSIIGLNSASLQNNNGPAALWPHPLNQHHKPENVIHINAEERRNLTEVIPDQALWSCKVVKNRSRAQEPKSKGTQCVTTEN